MAERTLQHLRIGLHHPRRPDPSRIELSLVPTDRKTGRLDAFVITEEQALSLAEEALAAVRIIRKNR